MPRLLQELQDAIEFIAKEELKDAKLKKWAESLFDDSIINALPLTNAKKKYKKRIFTEAVDFYRKFISDI